MRFYKSAILILLSVFNASCVNTRYVEDDEVLKSECLMSAGTSVLPETMVHALFSRMINEKNNYRLAAE